MTLVAHGTVVLEQQQDTPLQTVTAGPFVCRYVYVKGAESRNAGEIGQDFLGFRHGPGRLVFALCDGVGQSFCGDLASSHLGTSLLDLLWNATPEHLTSKGFSSFLLESLESLSAPLQEKLLDHPLPEDLPLMVRQELDKKRNGGSESTYVCGRVDVFSLGTIVHLSWMGDSRVRIWSGSEGQAVQQAPLDARERWSSHRGVMGTPNVFVNSGVRMPVTRIVAYSDGLAALDASDQPPDDDELQILIDRLLASDKNDDISFIDITWLGDNTNVRS